MTESEASTRSNLCFPTATALPHQKFPSYVEDSMDEDDEVPTLIAHEERPLPEFVMFGYAAPSSSSTITDRLESPPLLMSEKSDEKRVPCTLISGFLGAGKSTLLKRILTERHGYRIAVIMNEFGDTADIEARAVNVSSTEGTPGDLSEEFLELANGCLCCSIKDTGIASIEKLMKKKGAFDYILLETTGVADPGPIASLFWHNEEFATGLGQDIYLDGVICVVDAMFADKQMSEDTEGDDIGISLRQIACADAILLNKVDLVSEEVLVNLERRMQHTNPSAPIHRTVKGAIDLKHVIGLNAYASKPFIQASVAGIEHDHSDPNHSHSDPHGAVSSIQVNVSVLTLKRAELLDEWIRAVLWEGRLPGDDENCEPRLEVLRCKGVYALETGGVYVLQGVRSMYEISQTREEVIGLPEEGKLVFIGKGLGERERRSLHDLLNTTLHQGQITNKAKLTGRIV